MNDLNLFTILPAAPPATGNMLLGPISFKLYSDLTDKDRADPALTSLIDEFRVEWEEYFGSLLMLPKDWVLSGKAEALIAFVGQFPAGMCVFEEQNPSLIYSDGIVIRKDFRLRRVGAQLRDELMRVLRARGAEKFQINSVWNRKDAGEFHKQLKGRPGVVNWSEKSALIYLPDYLSIADKLPENRPPAAAAPGTKFTRGILASWSTSLFETIITHPILSAATAITFLTAGLAVQDVYKRHVMADTPHVAFSLSEADFNQQLQYFKNRRGLIYPLVLLISSAVLPPLSLEDVFNKIIAVLIGVPIYQAVKVLPRYYRLIRRIQNLDRLTRYTDLDLSKILGELKEAHQGNVIPVAKAIDPKDRQVRAVGLQWIVKKGQIKQSFALWYEEPYVWRWVGLLFPFVTFIAPTINWRSVKDRIKDRLNRSTESARNLIPQPSSSPIPVESHFLLKAA